MIVPPMRFAAVASALLVLLCFQSTRAAGAEDRPRRPDTGAASHFVGSAACKACHDVEFRAWSGSAHNEAMRDASAVVLPATAGEEAKFGKGASIRVRKADRHWSVSANEPGASAGAFDVRYVLGARSLEQFLAVTGQGRFQALPVGFDPAQGQWFDIFSGEERLPGEYGHWLGRGMNANSRCIECHATDYRKNYDASAASYASVWSEAGVGCEACHGAGSAHVADPTSAFGPFGKDAGVAKFRPTPLAEKAVEMASAAAPGDEAATMQTAASHSPAAPSPAAAAMLDVCATCHGVRRPIADGFVPGAAFLDFYDPVLIDEDNYRADGQVHTESYEWGSFVQSRMHAKGVSCLACHDVHSGELRERGNGLCLSCHDQSLAGSSHTKHEAGSAGSSCVACHMPESVFMARDRRRDHALTVPDPLAARETGLASACESCHTDRGRETLAVDAGRLWPALIGDRHAKRRARTKAFAAARTGDPGAAHAIRDCVMGVTCDTPILRASAAKLSVHLPMDGAMNAALLDALRDSDALVRSAAAFALADADPQDQAAQRHLAAAALDNVRAVRVNAAWALRTVQPEPGAARVEGQSIDGAFSEWRASMSLLSDAPESWHSIGLFESAQHNPAAAEAAYRKAISIEPRSVASRNNLAMLFVAQNRIDDAEHEFDALVKVDDSFAPAWYGLGVIAGEKKDWQEAAKNFGRCLKLEPGYPGALLGLTDAYIEAGMFDLARAVLNGALGYPSARRDALVGLVKVALKNGAAAEASQAAKALVAEDPSVAADPEIAKLLTAGDATDVPPAAARSAAAAR